MSLRFRENDHETILDPHIPIIDSHHHFVDKPGLRYMPEEYLKDASAGHNIVASVHLEINSFFKVDGPEMMRPIGEVEFVNGVGAMTSTGKYGKCHAAAGIVGYADLRFGARIGELLDRCLQAAPERFRGVRQTTIEHDGEAPYRYITNRPPVGVLDRADFREGLRELVKRGLTFDTSVFHPQLPKLMQVVDEFPELTFVLNHMGIAVGMDLSEQDRAEVFEQWRRSIRLMAQRPNVICKVGGLGMPFWGFGFEDRPAEPIGYEELATAWRSYVETSLEAFGAERCMAYSNFPPDARSCGFVPLWNALKHIVRGGSDEDKAAFFHGTAAATYRLAGVNL